MAGNGIDVTSVSGSQDHSRRVGRSLLVGVAVLAAGVAVVWVVLGASGAFVLVPSGLADAGPFVRWALPAVRTVHDLFAALTIGSFVLVAWLVAPGPLSSLDELTGTRRRLVRIGLAAGVAWGFSSALVLALTASDLSGVGVSESGFGSAVVTFVTETEPGRNLGISLMLIIIAADLAFLAPRVAAQGGAAALSIVAVLPMAFGGHAAGSRDHLTSVDSLAIHLVAVSLWVGGLAALVLVARGLGDQLPTVARRYSTLAGVCFVAVAGSGLIGAWLRLGSLDRLATSYGALTAGKAAALTLMGFAGWAHRRLTLRRIGNDRRWFVRLAAVELVVMGATVGLGVALSRSAPPTNGATLDRVSELLGYAAPPPLTVGHYLTTFHPDLLWLVVSSGLTAAYLAGLMRLQRRGDTWPWLRTTAWIAGCCVLIFVTSGGPGVYGRLQFSTHMLQHMSLMIIVPFLLVLGAPVTLAMRTIHSRVDGTSGPRELLAPVFR